MATQVQRRRGTTAENAAFTGAEGEFTYDTELKTIRVHDGSTEGGFPLMKQTVSVEPATKCKITYNEQGVITGGADLSTSDIPDLSGTYVAKNNAITGATKCKITYDSKGLVTSGADLAESDIPSLSISKVSGLQAALDGKLPKISVVEPTTTSGFIQLIDNAVNKVVLSGSATLVSPTVTDTTILHQLIVHLQKSNATWTVSFTADNFFGTSSAPSITTAGFYNIYYEYDSTQDVWVVGAIRKLAAA